MDQDYMTLLSPTMSPTARHQHQQGYQQPTYQYPCYQAHTQDRCVSDDKIRRVGPGSLAQMYAPQTHSQTYVQYGQKPLYAATENGLPSMSKNGGSALAQQQHGSVNGMNQMYPGGFNGSVPLRLQPVPPRSQWDYYAEQGQAPAGTQGVSQPGYEKRYCYESQPPYFHSSAEAVPAPTDLERQLTPVSPSFASSSPQSSANGEYDVFHKIDILGSRSQPPKQKFSMEEDHLTLRLRALGVPWHKIKEFNPGRSTKALQVHHSTALRHEKIDWTLKDDEELCQLVNGHEHAMWDIIATRMQNRNTTGIACRMRYFQLREIFNRQVDEMLAKEMES